MLLLILHCFLRLKQKLWYAKSLEMVSKAVLGRKISYDATMFTIWHSNNYEDHLHAHSHIYSRAAREGEDLLSDRRTSSCNKTVN